MWPKFLLWFVDPSHVHLCEVAARCSQTLFLLILHSQLCREEESNLLKNDHQFGTHRFFDTALLVTFQHVGRWLVANHLISELPTSQVQLGIVGSDLSHEELLPSVWPQLEKAEVKPQCLVHFFNLGQLQCNTWQKLQQRALRIHCALAFADT